MPSKGLPYSPVEGPMNGHTYPHYPLDGVSPLQPQYANAYQTPYPDSTASSAPSEDPVVADAEEDKRKRNQAASARFRQKKKQREQQMVEQSREMQEKNKKLEAEVEGLQRENQFLKRLLVEKIERMSDDDKELLAKTTNLGK